MHSITINNYTYGYKCYGVKHSLFNFTSSYKYASKVLVFELEC